VAFTSREPTLLIRPSDLEVMAADGNGRTVLVDGDADATSNESPAWSPDGRSIVFSRCPMDDRSECALFVVEADGTGLRRLTGVPGGAMVPHWNPVPR
jgi:TolB protein